MEPPIAIDRVERARGHGDEVRLRLSGRWLGPGDAAEHEALLVIQMQGRRHRFAASRTPAGAEPLPGNWQAEFTIPSWAVPDRPGQAAVWVGASVVAVGPPGSTSPPAADPRERPLGPRAVPEVAVPPSGPPEVVMPPSGPPEVAMPASPPSESQPAAATPAESGGGEIPADPAPVPDAPRAGPLADLLFKETVTALHAELERRSGEAAQLRGALADARSELDARAGRQAGLETAHGELRRELEQLMGAVARQRQDFDERLRSIQEELERAREQAAMATAVRDDAAAELTRAREAAGALSDQLRAQADAERRSVQEAAALRAQLAAAQISRDAAISEAGGLRAELERLGGELTVVREQTAAQGGNLGEAQRLLADARALTEQLRDQSGG